MPDFLAQSYLADRGKALAALGRARQIRSPLLLGAILVPGGGIFLTLWHGLTRTRSILRCARWGWIPTGLFWP